MEFHKLVAFTVTALLWEDWVFLRYQYSLSEEDEKKTYSCQPSFCGIPI